MIDMIHGWRALGESGLKPGWYWQISANRPVYVFSFRIVDAHALFTTLVPMIHPDKPHPHDPPDLLVPTMVLHDHAPYSDLVAIETNPRELPY